MKTLMVALMMALSLGAAGPARGAGDPAGAMSEIRAQGRGALLVVHTSQRVRVAPDHRRALAAAAERFAARSRAVGHDGPALGRALAGIRQELRERFRELPPRGAFPVWSHEPAVAQGSRMTARRGRTGHTVITPR